MVQRESSDGVSSNWQWTEPASVAVETLDSPVLLAWTSQTPEVYTTVTVHTGSTSDCAQRFENAPAVPVVLDRVFCTKPWARTTLRNLAWRETTSLEASKKCRTSLLPYFSKQSAPCES